MNRRILIAMSATTGLAALHSAGADNEDNPNNQLAIDYIENVWNEGDVNAIDSYISPDYQPVDDEDTPGIDAFKARFEASRAVMTSMVPDISYAVEAAIAAENYAVTRGMLTGSETNGREFRHWFLSMVLIEDGLIKTEWALVS